jgi:hypothetical protein
MRRCCGQWLLLLCRHSENTRSLAYVIDVSRELEDKPGHDRIQDTQASVHQQQRSSAQLRHFASAKQPELPLGGASCASSDNFATTRCSIYVPSPQFCYAVSLGLSGSILQKSLWWHAGILAAAAAQVQLLQREIELYDPAICSKPAMVVLTKADLLGSGLRLDSSAAAGSPQSIGTIVGLPAVLTSASTGFGLEALRTQLESLLHTTESDDQE